MSKTTKNNNKGRTISYGRFDFLGSSKLFATISVVAVLASLALIATNGFRYGIDFSGGTEIQVQFDKPIDAGKIRSFTKDMGYKGGSVQSIGEDNEYLIRLGSLKGETEKDTNKMINDMIKKITTGITETFSADSPSIRRVGSVGPQVGAELKRSGLLAAFYCLLLILIYVALRFDYKYAPGAVFCLFHDAIITLGIFSLFGREVNIQTMAAILTIIGYSLNDTIVTFDRIRENEPLFRDQKFTFIVNKSINDVLSRTLLTSITTFLSILAMYFIAGGVIKDFAFTLGIGVVVGTYSSIFVASPLVVIADMFQKNKEAARAAKAARA